ncbi:hypothetical protein [Actinocatenispora rupis]|uniref:Uncharacterized protein n=1 Tax=Actinocatenispora rupis TaxID=519421 RepID=A0A8J3J422_9ACTN|nr:hypothetical protein [Actinocatenispora rupis]GID15401.1 hypothetical protein Aru02nite_62900 [Actinocatenispora rupis]
MTPAPTEYRNHRGRYALLALGVLPMVLTLTAILHLLTGQDAGPLDVTLLLFVLALMGFVVVLAAVLVAATDRSRVLVGPGGITNVPFGPARSTVAVPWPEVTGVRARWTPVGWNVRLSRRHGRAVTLAGPVAPPWWPDQRFRRELAEIQAWLPVGATRPALRPAVSLAYLLWVPVLLAALGMTATLSGGVVGPWTATATSTPHACALLQPALKEYQSVRYGPSGSTTMSHYEDCEFWSKDRSDGQPVSYLSATVDHDHGILFSSPVAVTMRDFATACADLNAVAVQHLGDEACAGTKEDPDDHTVLVRRADAIVTIEATGTDGERLATSLARQAVPLVQVS